MKNITGVGRRVFAVAVAGTLGLGATQLLAAPGAPAYHGMCSEEQCTNECLIAGYYGGHCDGANPFSRCKCGELFPQEP